MPNPGARVLMEKMKKNNSASTSISATAAATSTGRTSGENSAAPSADSSEDSTASLRASLQKERPSQFSQESNESNDNEGVDNNEREEDYSTQQVHNDYEQALLEGGSPEQPKTLFTRSENDTQMEDHNRLEEEIQTRNDHEQVNHQDLPDHIDPADNEPSQHVQIEERAANYESMSITLNPTPTGFLDLEAYNQLKRKNFLEQQKIEIRTAMLLLKKAKTENETNAMEIESKKVDLELKKINLEAKKKELAIKDAKLDLLHETKKMATSITNYFNGKSLSSMEIPGKRFLVTIINTIMKYFNISLFSQYEHQWHLEFDSSECAGTI